MRNWIPERGRLSRKAFSPDFTVKPDTAGGDIWHLRQFQYVRASGHENKLLIFRDDGKVYRKQSSYEQEIWPATAVNVTSSVAGTAAQSGGGTAWTNITNTAASDDAYASVTLAAGATSQRLELTNFGFAIASTSNILGITLEIECNSPVSANAVRVFRLQLMYGGTVVGTEKELVVSPVASDSTLAFGSSTDLWGFGPSPAIVNTSTFGIAITANEDAGLGGYTLNGDIVRLTVHYGSTVSTLVNKPFARQLGNRFFFSDNVSQKVYDGRGLPRDWGLARTTTAPSVAAANVGGSVVAATGVKGAITWVILDEQSNRVHESSRTNLNASFVVIGGADDAVTVDISALTPPAHATHWSAYISELDGSEVLRRAATTAIATTSVTITAFPAATTAKAPIRNDPPPKSRVGWIAKNRIFVCDDANPNRFYFSALGEVVGLSNGAAEESFPGYGSNSVSDLINSDTLLDPEVRAGVEHENIIFVFGNRRGYAYIGEMNLLDNRAPRSLVKLQQFDENCAGPDALASTPYGLAWMNSGRRIFLWSGGQELQDIGEPIQELLDTIPSNELDMVYFHWYSGNGRQWLAINCKATAPDNASGSSEQNRTLIYDFARLAPNRSGQPQPGAWLEWTDITGTCAATYLDNEGLPFLLIGDTNSTVKQADVIANPAHLEYTATLGQTYLASSPQNNPACTLRTGLLTPAGDTWATGQYLQILSGDQNGAGAVSAGSLSDPTVVSWVDIENPDSPGTSISLTLDTATSAGDKRAWLVPQSSGNTNVGGALGKQFLFQASYATGNDATGESDGRTSARINSLYRVGFTFTPQKEATV